MFDVGPARLTRTDYFAGKRSSTRLHRRLGYVFSVLEFYQRQTHALTKDSGIVRPWMIIYKAGFKGGTGLITLTPQDVVKHQTMACHRFPADCVGCYIGVSGLQP